MSTDINLSILDRFRHVDRLLRTASVPCGDMKADNVEEDGKGTKGSEQSQPAWGVLIRDAMLPFLLCSEQGMKQKEIADEIRVSPSTLSEMINRLVECGYVERKPDPEDRRAKRLYLTEKGKIRAEEILYQVKLVLDCLFSNLQPEEKEELIRLLDKLVGRDSDSI